MDSTHIDRKVLVVADSADDRAVFEALLGTVRNARIQVAGSVETAAALPVLAAGEGISAVLFVPPPDGGRRVLDALLAAGRAPVLVVNEADDAETAAAALKRGAADYLVKARLSGAVLLRAIDQAMARWDPVARRVQPLVLPGKSPRPEPEPRAPKPAAAPPGAPEETPENPNPVEVRYSTSGIDAAMEKMGLHRPRRLSDVLAEARKRAEQALHSIKESPDAANYAMLAEIASLIQEHLTDSRDVEAGFAFRFGEEEYLGGNAVNVAMIAHLILTGLKVERQFHVDVMIAALLHEIGFLLADIPPSDAPEAIAEHARRGGRALREIGAPPTVYRAVAEHEEHADGSGLPEGLSGDAVSLEAQCVLAGVTYSNLYYHCFLSKTSPGTPPRYRGVPITISDPLMAISRTLRPWFRPEILRTVILQMGFYSVGALVQLSNDAIARVISQNPGNPSKPVVELVQKANGERPKEMTFLDLSKNPALSIVKVLSFERIT